jgi:hypothetical protein
MIKEQRLADQVHQTHSKSNFRCSSVYQCVRVTSHKLGRESTGKVPSNHAVLSYGTQIK